LLFRSTVPITYWRDGSSEQIRDHLNRLVGSEPDQIGRRISGFDAKRRGSGDKWQLAQGIGRVESPLADPWERVCVRTRCVQAERHRPLRMPHEKERKIIAVVEDSETRANDRVPVGRIRETNARLKPRVSRVDLLLQPFLEIPANSIVQREFRRNAPLILREEPVVAVVYI
jgi:hypothetical protein